MFYILSAVAQQQMFYVRCKNGHSEPFHSQHYPVTVGPFCPYLYVKFTSLYLKAPTHVSTAAPLWRGHRYSPLRLLKDELLTNWISEECSTCARAEVSPYLVFLF